MWANNRKILDRNCSNIAYLIKMLHEKSRVDVLVSLPLINRLAFIINKRILYYNGNVRHAFVTLVNATPQRHLRSPELLRALLTCLYQNTHVITLQAFCRVSNLCTIDELMQVSLHLAMIDFI